jgi:dTDP-4-amino-4,6-dideoxygalactose transaminase
MDANYPLLVSNPRLNYLASKSAIDQAAIDFFNNPQYILGDPVELFEDSFAQFIETDHAVGVANGTDAITLALMASDIGSGDEVITVSLTAVATIVGIERSGATPVLVDVDSETRVIDSSLIISMITDCTKAIVAVHLYGQPANLSELQKICFDYNLLLIEDCAQAHGATYDGKQVGSIAPIAAFSFYPTKNLGAIGDGGMVVTRLSNLDQRLRKLRQYGWETPQWSLISGLNSRLDGLQAAILQVKLSKLKDNIRRRQQIATFYTEAFASCPVTLPVPVPNTTHAYHLYVIELKDPSLRPRLFEYLRSHHIFAGIHYPHAVHQQPAYGKLRRSEMTNTELLTQSIISLPMYPEMTDEEVNYTTNIFRNFFDIL